MTKSSTAKARSLGKMPGDDWQRFANVRAYLRLHVGPSRQEAPVHGPGVRPDDASGTSHEALDWWLLDHWPHQGVQALIARPQPSLSRHAGAPRARLRAGRASAGSSSTTTPSRSSPSCGMGEADDPPVAVVCNFTPVPRNAYRIGLPLAGRWREMLNTDAQATAAPTSAISARHRRAAPVARPAGLGGADAAAARDAVSDLRGPMRPRDERQDDRREE